jgi:hypothetical protein
LVTSIHWAGPIKRDQTGATAGLPVLISLSVAGIPSVPFVPTCAHVDATPNVAQTAKLNAAKHLLDRL